MTDREHTRLELSRIGAPLDYIRGAVDRARVAEFVEIARSKGWIFPEIEVYRLGEPETIKGRLITHRISDGVTRHAAFTEVYPNDPIPAVVVPFLEPADAYDAQWLLNHGHGKPFDPEVRNNYIRRAAKKYGRTPEQLVELTGLSQASISRIIAEKQGRTRAEVTQAHRAAAATRKPRKSKKKKTAANDDYDARPFLSALKAVRGEIKSNRKALVTALLKRDAVWSDHIKPTIEALEGLRGD